MKYPSSYLIFMVVVSQSRLAHLDKFDIRILKQHVSAVMDDQLGFSGMQKHVGLLAYQTMEYEGGVIVEKIAKRLAKKISRLLKDMQEARYKLSYFAKDIHLMQNFMGNFPLACCAAYSRDETFYDGSAFKANMNFKELCSSMSAGSINSWGISSKVIQLINANFEGHSFLDRQYLTAQDGVFTFFPTEDSPCVSVGRKPRPKSWFVQASTLKRRHVVVLLDTSYSMSHTHNSRTLLKNGIDAVEHLIDSALSTTKIDVVAFNNSVTTFHSCGKFLSFRPELQSRQGLLKKHLLSDLTAGGQSYFADGFQAAFQLLRNEAGNATTDTNLMTILLISDGGASEIFNNRTHEIYQAIVDGNEVLNNTVRIFTYGVGRTDVNMDLLRDIARQEFIAATGQHIGKMEALSGLAFRIDEPDMLGSLLQSFYNHLDNNPFINTPVISPPFFDHDTGTVKVTSVVHMYNNQTDFDVILAADFSMEELMKEVLLEDYQPSYFFIIGKDGTVLFHPSISRLDHVEHEFNMPPIEQLEPFHEVHHLVTKMITGHAGQSPVTSKQHQSNPTVKEQVNYTYYWHPITDTEYTLCFVEERFDHSVFITSEYAISGCMDKDKILPASLCPDTVVLHFRHHKLIEANEVGICDYFKKPSTIKGSAVKFAPRCYKSSSDIDSMETTAMMKAYRSFFNKIFNATSFIGAKYMLDDGKYSDFIHDSLHKDVVSDVLWTAIIDNIWIKNSAVCIARRFIATKSGVMRLFPGTRLPSNYDSLKREWYQTAVSHPSLTVISMPYEDAAGAGIVITLSQAITKPRFDTSKFNNKVIAVMGLDIHPFCLETAMVRLYPTCTNEWFCSIVNWDGYVIHHINHWGNLREKSPFSDHLISHNGDLAKLLLRQGTMKKVRCFELTTGKFKVSYRILQGAQLNTMSSRNMCTRYIMEQIPHTNAFFVAREHHDTCYYKTCLKDNTCGLNSECIFTEIWPNSQCECPCTMKIEADPCSRHTQGRWNDTILCTSSSHDNLQSSYCPAEHIDRCFSDSSCKNLGGPLECAQKTGCVWCVNSKQGPICENVQDCFEKSYFNASSGDEDSCRLNYSSSGLQSSTVIASTTTSGATAAFIIFIVLVTTCCRRKESYQFPKSTPDNFMETDGNAITTVTWNQIQSDENPDVSRNSQGKLKARMHEKQHNVGNSQKMPKVDKNDSAMMSSNSSLFVTQSPDTCRRGIFRQHKEPRDIEERKVAKLKSLPVTTESTPRPYFPSSRTGMVHKRRRDLDSPATATDTSITKNKTAPAKESNAVTKLFQSVLKKRSDKGSDALSSNDIYMENFSTSLENVPSYFKMFAEPVDNEGDIPIIQSDDSDNESLKNSSKV